MDLFADVLSAECIHGLTKRTCSICLERLGWGKLGQHQYRTHLADLYPEKYGNEDPPARYCEECKNRGACKGNRVNVRLPRPPISVRLRERRPGDSKHQRFGAPVYPPSWEGPLVTKPKVRRATHRLHGKWLCDKCDPNSPIREDVTSSPKVFRAADIFG